MHEIRINQDGEKEIIKIRFKICAALLVSFGLIFLLFLGSIILVALSYDLSNDLLIVGIFVCILFFIPTLCGVLWARSIKRSFCTITDRRIVGTVAAPVFNKRFSYRLDEIDSVETVNRLGNNILMLNFVSGHGPRAEFVRRGTGGLLAPTSRDGVFQIPYIANIDEVYEKLSKVIVQVKSQTDLMTDIEMSKVDAENRKAAAIENMANNMGQGAIKGGGGQNYIQELKDLKELLVAGIITEAEFEQKKRQILNK